MNGAELSLWDRFKIFITPKSHAEELVDQIYGEEGRGLIPVPPAYEPENASMPAKLVEIKQEVTGAVSRAVTAVTDTAKSSFIKIGIVAFVAIAALVAINAFVKR